MRKLDFSKKKTQKVALDRKLHYIEIGQYWD